MNMNNTVLEDLANEIAMLSNDDIQNLSKILATDYRSRAEKLEWNISISIHEEMLGQQ
jgi:hypothetical protein